tara:strand:- start:2216 stop:2731 length:516 start_codon:yes stop_codon:yes gene_type:complete
MAGSLIKIAETTVSSATASVTLTGIDSTYNVYQVVINNVQSVDDNVGVYIRVTTSGTADSDSEYDFAKKVIRADSSFGNESNTNQDKTILGSIGTATGETTNGIFYCYNFNNASEFSFATFEMSYRNASGSLKGDAGGFVHTVAEANDGVNFFMQSGNIASGTFTLYGLKK